MIELNVNQMINELEDANKKMDVSKGVLSIGNLMQIF
jgi:hypothetical protein